MNSVHLHIYDLSQGLAKQLSLLLLGEQIEGIYHTGVVVYGREWYFSVDGIQNVEPKGTVMNEPNKIEYLGDTKISEKDFLRKVKQFSEGVFKNGTYNLLNHNCNVFSDQLIQFLLNKNIPKYINYLPEGVLNTPIGSMLESMFMSESKKQDTASCQITRKNKPPNSTKRK